METLFGKCTNLVEKWCKITGKILEGKTDNNKLDRWSLELQGRGIKCVHIPGTQNKAADCLSKIAFCDKKKKW